MDEDPIKEALEEITAATKAEETKDEESTAEVDTKTLDKRLGPRCLDFFHFKSS